METLGKNVRSGDVPEHSLHHPQETSWGAVGSSRAEGRWGLIWKNIFEVLNKRTKP